MKHKITGIVVAESDRNENDKQLKILTGEEGVLNVRAYGVKKLSASNLRSAQLFAYSDLLLNEKDGLYSLQESALKEDFYDLRSDVTAYALGCYLCELAAVSSVGGEEGAEILRLLLNALYATEKRIAPPLVVKSAFEFRLAALIGYLPDLSGCPICGKPLAEMQESIFELTDGYIFCKTCENPAEGYTRRAPVSRPCLQAMLHILSAPVNKIFLFRLEEHALRELSALTEAYLLLRTERKLNTLEFLKQNL